MPASKKSFLHIAPGGEDKGCWVAMAKSRGLKLEDWVIATLNAAVPAPVREEVRRKFALRQK